ncbi:cytokinin dehydrogenase 4 isoform X2 [Physcomitrium patens]|nr:cytokinin dehydrogenase 4-like isoform X2 [Physcomitrium patens]|eukprot:XP_024383193.1 cytokinin dehydrogenase 4-like isoform X2 [Physcomitrella patens]
MGEHGDELSPLSTIHEQGSSLSFRDHALLSSLRLDGSLTFSNTSSAASDFGRIRYSLPGAILYPKSVRDVELAVRAVQSSKGSGLTLAAKGSGHSVHGQAQALRGVVIEMSTLKGIKVAPNGEPGFRHPFVDAAGGELWIDILKATLREGLAPRSWTDYLYLSIGGTLSNAGVGGQSFLFGPEISNVLQLDVVTGTSQLVKCSPTKKSDLFHGVLGGLGQFGIITSARIILEPAHEKVRWIRAMYTDFATFTRDQEMLVTQAPESAFDYIEGFVVLKNKDSSHGWNSVPFDAKKIDPSIIPEEGGSVLYCIELVKKFSPNHMDTLNKTVERMVAPLSFIPTLIFTIDVPYEKFLNRLHEVEISLDSQGLWNVPHPWLNLFVPRSSIGLFDALIFKQMIKDDFSGPILIYPLNRNWWDSRSSAVIPDESIFYLVGFLRISLPSSGALLGNLIADNDKIMQVCHSAKLGCKKYLPEYEDTESWKLHFGKKWGSFTRRKQKYDPDFILAPGQNIFSKSTESRSL